jgi:hypothetical protein
MSGAGGFRAVAGSAPADGALCARCENDPECSEGICLVNDDTRERFCGRTCSGGSSCPSGYICAEINGSELQQCVPQTGSCDRSSSGSGTGGSSSSGSGGRSSGGTASMVPGPIAGTCDPGFLGPFCENDAIIGFERGPEIDNPTLQEVREFSVQAVNYIRSLTCLEPLALDSCLNDIATAALGANQQLGIHGYFKQNCMNAAHDFGDSCECDWGQENFGAASGTRRTWKDGVIVPLCGMMEEPKGVGHRANIEGSEWTRLGVGVDYSSNGASWYHEFGR